MRTTNSNNAAVAAESHKIGADSFIIETRIELFRIADRFSEWEKRMCESKELLMDGRLDNKIRTMNTAFYQLDEALRRIMNEDWSSTSSATTPLRSDFCKDLSDN